MTGDVRNARMQVIDALGRAAIDRPYPDDAHRTRLDVSGLVNGAYVLRLQWAGGSIDRRFNVLR